MTSCPGVISAPVLGDKMDVVCEEESKEEEQARFHDGLNELKARKRAQVLILYCGGHENSVQTKAGSNLSKSNGL